MSEYNLFRFKVDCEERKKYESVRDHYIFAYSNSNCNQQFPGLIPCNHQMFSKAF